MGRANDVSVDVVDTTFKALADETRRCLLDHLREQQGQTLPDLAARLNMSRPAVNHHLSVLETAKLVSIVTSGGKKKHYYVNPRLLRQVRDNWLEKFI